MKSCVIKDNRKCVGVLGALGAAAIDFGFDTASNYLQGKMDKANSKDLMDYQNKLYLQQQSTLNQRLYPQQAASMRMAGLNPAMISGPMSQSASMSSATQNKQAARMNIAEGAAAVAQMEKLESDIDVNKATAENLRAEAENKTQDTTNKKLEEEILGNRLFTWFEDWKYEKSLQAGQSYLFNEQGDYYKNQAILSQKDVQVAEETINKLQQEVTNLVETRKKIMAETAHEWSKKEYQDKVNAKYDEVTDASIQQIKQYTKYMDHDDQRQAAEIVKRLVRMDIENETAVWQQLYLQDLKDAQSFQNYLNRRYGDGDRFLNQTGEIINQAAKAYGVLKPEYVNTSTVTNTYNGKGALTGRTETSTRRY